MTHDASVQRINEHKDVFQSEDGASEFNFKDTYKFNIAAWKLARLLGIDDMMPPYVERKLATPNEEMYVVRVFDQLIFNTDRNVTNLLIDKHWHIWMIDHSRAFRIRHDLRSVKNLVKCDRKLLARMKALDEATLRKELSFYVNDLKIQGLLARRDLIVKFFESKGESTLYDRSPRS